MNLSKGYYLVDQIILGAKSHLKNNQFDPADGLFIKAIFAEA